MDERWRNDDWRRGRDDWRDRDWRGGGGRWGGREGRSFGRAGRHGLRVAEVMHRGAEVLDPDLTLEDAARCMREDNLGAYPVGENDRLIGMITDRDIVVRAVAHDCRPSRTTVREVMSEHVLWCYEDDDLDDAAELMARHQVRRIPVLNRNKRLVGMLALADLGRSRDERAAERALEGVSEPSGQPRRWS